MESRGDFVHPTEMSKEELDMLILGQLDAHRSCQNIDRPLEEVSARSRRVVILYYFRGKSVCKKTYFFACCWP